MSDRNPMVLTGAMVLMGLASVAGAYAMRPVEVQVPTFEDTGEPFFAGFDDPAQARALEVIAWDDAEARARAFSVAFKEGRWVIPSHNDYPADAVERMASAAAGFVGVRKDIYRGDRVEDHQAYGVEDPESADASDGGRGIHVRIGDGSGTDLVDVIVGKSVEGKPGYRYLRPVGSDRVYAARMKLDLSTDFADWIDADLLRLERDEIVAVSSNAYRVDEETGRVVGHDPLRLERRADADWVPVEVPSGDSGKAGEIGQAEPLRLPKGREVDDAVLSGLLSGLDRLEIVGVRPQPAKLTQGALLAKGFFLSQNLEQLFGNEGEVSVQTRDGIIYTLYFGEVSYESGEALTAGLEDASTDPSVATEDGAKKAHRYMFVTVAYDPELDQTKDDPPPEAPSGDPTARPPLRGEARAQALRARFDRWFYVVDDASFERIRRQREDFFKVAAK